MSNKNKLFNNWPRYILQWGVLAAIILFLTGIIKTASAADPETYCPMGGLQAFVTYLVRGSLPCSMSSVQIVMGLALAAAVILFSKLFCAYICPIGTVEDLLIKLRKSIRLNPIVIRNQSVLDKILRIFKYALLFWIMYSTVGASELFCKNIDPYYAVATGFKGEITLWMSITALVLVVLFGLFIDNFWCRYICPLGAASNTFKFWLWILVLGGVCYLASISEIVVPWWIFLAAFCLVGYLLEIFRGRSKLQLLYVQKNMNFCNKCHACEKHCPYNIPLGDFGSRIDSIDCTLCGECINACRSKALHIGIVPSARKNFFNLILPAVLAAGIAVAAFFMGRSYEIPTINEQWGIYSEDSLHTQLVDPSILKEAKLEGLKQIHCFGSSRAFQGKLEKIKGVYGVKTFVRSHSAIITYDPAVTSPEAVMEEIYVPSRFKGITPDWRKVPMLKVLTIRTEKMPSTTDVNLLGIQFKQVDSLIYGLDSQWDCPLVVHMYVDPAFDRDEKWIKEIVNKPTLDLMTAKGEIKSTPLGFEFVRMEPGVDSIATTEFLQNMFKTFTAEFSSRVEAAQGKQQFVYEIADESFSKPMISRSLPFVSNHLSRNEGIIGVYTRLNTEYVPSLMVRFCEPMTAKEIWKQLTLDEWTITYSADDIRTVPAKIKFKKAGVVYPYVEGAEPKAEEK